MNISIYFPVCLVQIFLWGCVTCSFLGLIMLLAGWGKKVIEQRHGYWLLVLHLTMQKNSAKEWTWGMFRKLIDELREENPKLVRELREILEKEFEP